MRIPDWVVYVLVLGVVLTSIFSARSRNTDAPPAPPEEIEAAGSLLPPPSPFDDQILIQVDNPRDGVGTAFAVNRRGQWLTARHVVEGCRDVGLFVRAGVYVPADSVKIDPRYDLALITTGRAPSPVELDLDSELEIGTEGFHVGYPQGRPGEAVARLHSRSTLIMRGARRGREPALSWVEVGRTRGLYGSLGGLSGGPVFDREGRVRGVIIAESPRRGRIYTAAPRSIARFLEEEGTILEAETERYGFNIRNYGGEADRARRTGQVVKVACRVGAEGE